LSCFHFHYIRKSILLIAFKLLDQIEIRRKMRISILGNLRDYKVRVNTCVLKIPASGEEGLQDEDFTATVCCRRSHIVCLRVMHRRSLLVIRRYRGTFPVGNKRV
jgi:hypothetical protein